MMKHLFAAFASTLFIGANMAANPPKAPVRPVTDTYHGVAVVDPYRYMEDLGNPDVQAWMKAQADHTRSVLDALPGRAALLARMLELLHATPNYVGWLRIVDDHYYTMRFTPGEQQRKLYVRGGANGSDRLLIDPEKRAGGETGLLEIQWYAPSPDNRYVAYSLAAAGSEAGVMHILDTTTGKDLPETADRADHARLAWRPDSDAFFHTRLRKTGSDEPATAKYQDAQVHLHRLGHPFEEDLPVFGRGVADAAIALAPSEEPILVTRPGSRWALAVTRPGDEPRVRVYAAPVASLGAGETTWRPIAPSYEDDVGGVALESEESVTGLALDGDTLYWLSRKNAPRGRILALDLAVADSTPRVVVDEGELPINRIAATDGALYWLVSDAGVNQLRRLAHAAGARTQTPSMPYPAHVGSIATGTKGDVVVISTSSWMHQPAYLGLDAKTGAFADNGMQAKGAFASADDVTADEVKATSWDGTRVPLSIIHRKGLKRDGSHIVDLSGYGAYGISQTPIYTPLDLALLERGMVLATCHVRGGGEYGEPWHEAGFQATKPNTWKDFIACAEYLVEHGYTRPSKLTGRSGSAGGVLIGRAIEERPDLFTAAIAEVPVTDLLRFETTANGVPNVAEFGSVKTRAGFDALRAMSPYANVVDGTRYPAMLVTTGINDPRVDAWMPAKLAARLQAATTSGKPVLLRVDYASGHRAASIEQAFDEMADVISFQLWQTGHPDFQPRQAAGND